MRGLIAPTLAVLLAVAPAALPQLALAQPTGGQIDTGQASPAQTDTSPGTTSNTTLGTANTPPAEPAPAQPHAEPASPPPAPGQPATTQQAQPPAAPGQQDQANGPGPAAGTPEVQAPVPETQNAGENAQRQVPQATDTPAPTGNNATPPQPSVAPTPVTPIPAPPPFPDRGQPDAAELELQRALHGGSIHGRVSIPDAKAGNLVHPAGRDWRAFHNVTLLWIAGIAILGTAALLAVFYLIRGRVRVQDGFSGREMVRFTFIERMAHWMTASSFIVLALSGLNLTFGRHLLLPVIGPEAFTAVSAAGKFAHNFLAFPFTLGIVLLFVMWVGGNIPNKLDLVWLKMGGGMVGKGHPPAARFNAGQKGVFWITVLGGAIVAASGYMLVFPFAVTGIDGQQWAHMAHGTLSAVMIAVMLGHIYIGTLGMEGAFAAMGRGKVDYNWAREHHSLWVEEELAKAHEVVRPGSTTGPNARPAGAD